MATARHIAVGLAVAVVSLLFIVFTAAAEPRVGQRFPTLAGRDLLGTIHNNQEWVGRPTLVVAITNPDAGDAMQRWFDSAERLRGRAHFASLLALRLPFYATEGLARSRARQRVPRAYWRDTWLDRGGGMARTLGLAPSLVPYVFALDERGNVLASVHGTADAPAAQAIWSALR